MVVAARKSSLEATTYPRTLGSAGAPLTSDHPFISALWPLLGSSLGRLNDTSCEGYRAPLGVRYPPKQEAAGHGG